MDKIDFEKEKPYFENGDMKWYICKHFQKYLESKQAENLPKLKDLGCFIVKGKNIQDYVLIDGKQNVITGYEYPKGYDQMLAIINIIKISQHYDEFEKTII